MAPKSLFTFTQVKRSQQLGGRHYDWVQWDLLKRNARVYGDREALADTFLGLEPSRRRRRTWRQVFADVNTMIVNLLDGGMRRGSRVVSHLPNCLESAYLDFVTSKLGWMHCGLNVDLGKAETLGAIGKVRPDLAVIVPEWHGREFLAWYREGRDLMPGMQIAVLTKPGEAAPGDTIPLSELLNTDVWARYSEADLGYLRTDPLAVHELLPTAGTTGVPKISMRTTVDWFHVHSVCIAERAGHTVYDARILIGPLSGGSGRLWGVHTPLYTGGRVIYLTEFDEETVCRLTAEERLTIYVWNPALITRVVTSPFFEMHDLGTLRLVSYSGAPMGVDVIEKLLDRGVVPFNVYGTSEVGGCMSPILPGAKRDRLLTGAGAPFEGFDVPVVDPHGDRLPPGDVGEILIWNMHHGYLDAPEESRATYHAEAYGDRWDGYQHTGDLGVYDQDGYLRVVGRTKDMILRGAQNIFPREIEDVLSQHPRVRDIAVVAMPDPVLGERLCAFVVAAGGKVPTVEELASFLGEREIAKFKWPERVEGIDAMPLGPGGKIVRATLRQIIAEKLGGQASGGSGAPRDS
jgi:acyl-CoA synthetase (AMP-forming)/AMP-acid ligase II